MQLLGLESLAFRYLVAVDIEGYSQRDTARQARAQDTLERAMSRAASSAGLDRENWYRLPGGDGELAVLPEGSDGLALIADYPRALASGLNCGYREKRERRLRLRLAIHHGAVAPGCFGPVGRSLVEISRLVDSDAVRQQLRQRNDLDVALVVSSTVYHEVIQSGLRDLDPGGFRRVCTRAKGISYVGYLSENTLTRPGPAELSGARLAASV